MENQAHQEESAEEYKAQRQKHIANNISSNVTGQSRAGDIVADKRVNLLHAQGKPQIGLRNDPDPEPPWYKRRSFYWGILSGLVVVFGVMILLMAVGSNTTIG